MNGTVLEVVRDCDALLIPNGIPVTIRKGEQVMVMQAIGGTYTVSLQGNLARIDAKDADALGLDPALLESNSFVIPEELTSESVWEVLSTCYDPEIPVNIVELGLIYKMLLEPLEDPKTANIMIEMTLTAAGCGMGPVLVNDIKTRLLKMPQVKNVEVELVFDPPWNQGLMSEAAKLQLGFL
jgi:probable FeS assembly SUF system protein SufT